MKYFGLICALLVSGSLAAQPTFTRVQGQGIVTVTEGSGTLRGLAAGFNSLIRRSVQIEMEYDPTGKMSVVQNFYLGPMSWENRFDVLWIFDTHVPGQLRYRLVNTGDGRELGKAYCSPSACDYDLDFSELNIKISERLEKNPGSPFYDLMGTLTESNSWMGKLQVYYRVQLKPVGKTE